VECKDLETTLKLGAEIGRKLKGGEVIELIGDVGSGKTSLVRGIADGAGSTDPVASPTFTLARQYSIAGKGLTIDHYDFYRLSDPGILTAELEESMADPKTSVLIEWSQIVKGVLPELRVKISIEVGKDKSQRKFNIFLPTTLEYLIEGLRS